MLPPLGAAPHPPSNIGDISGDYNELNLVNQFSHLLKQIQPSRLDLQATDHYSVVSDLYSVVTIQYSAEFA